MTGTVVALSGRHEIDLAFRRAMANLDAEAQGSVVYGATDTDDPGLVLSLRQERFRPSPAVVDEARRHRSQAMLWLVPVSPDVLREWLLAVNSVVANPQDESGFEAFFNAAWMTLGQYPAPCFTKATLREAQTNFAFFPSVSVIVALIKPVDCDLRKQVDAINRLANYDAGLDRMRRQQAFKYGPSELAACLEAWNQSAARTGLDPIEPHHVAAQNELAAIIARYGLAGWRRALDAIEGSRWLRSKRPTFDWLAGSEARFTRTIR